MSPQPSPRPSTPSQQYKDKHTYIPPQVERAITQSMERSMPAHLRQYAGAYVQQHMASSGPGTASQAAQPQFTPHAPSFHAPRQTQAYQPQPAPGQVVQPPPANGGQEDAYNFITHPEPPAPRRFSLPGGNSSLPIRIALALGALLVLIILFSIIRGLLGGGSDLTPFISIAQDQQELIHLTSSVTQQQQNVSTANRNFAATTQLAIGSAQGAIVKYLATNGKKVNAKTLALKVNASTDAQLTAAAAATTYDQTFQQIMQTKLTAYSNELQRIDQKTTGKNGRALLKSDYSQAQLLLTQLNGPAQ